MTQSKNKIQSIGEFFDGTPKLKMDIRAIRTDSDDLDEKETFRETMASSCNHYSVGSGVETMETQK